MEFSYIKVEQLLFGYSNGHHLLTTSISLSERTQKKLEVLSDLSGPDIQQGFTEYITGYPLENENYYALCKTWYAPEMKRPGCVWTHMLLFKNKDLGKIKNCKNLLDLFVRPEINTDKRIYSEQMKINYYDNRIIDLSISIDKLKFIQWAVYTNDEPIIIPADKSTDYLYEIYKFWVSQDELFMSAFSFCTGVLGNRNIEKKVIDLQVVPYGLLKSIARQNKQVKVIDEFHEKVTYPVWIDLIINENGTRIMTDFNKFRSCFGNRYFNKRYFEKFANLYIETGIIGENATLKDFMELVSKIFFKEDISIIQSIMVEQLLKRKHLQWFNYDSVVNVLLDLSIDIDLYNLDINYMLIDEMIDVVWMEYPDKVKYILEELINNKINLLGEKLVKGFANKTLPEQLPRITNMNLGLCNLMIKVDNKLALCVEIWNQSKDFQLEIVNCLEVDNKNILLAKQILVIILENSSFDLSDYVYIKFGDMSISTFLDWYCTTQVSDDKKVMWMKICNNNPNECLKWMRNVENLKDINILIRLINILDPYSDEVVSVDKSFWMDIFYSVDKDNLREDYKIILAQFFMTIILLKKELFPNEIVSFSFSIIHNRIAEQKFEYRNWERLEKLLPEVAWNNSWDKCKRLRKAMKQKGYRL